MSCTLLARGRSGTGGVVPARVADLLIGLDCFDWAAVYGGAVDLLVSTTVLYTWYEYSFDQVDLT